MVDDKIFSYLFIVENLLRRGPRASNIGYLDGKNFTIHLSPVVPMLKNCAASAAKRHAWAHANGTAMNFCGQNAVEKGVSLNGTIHSRRNPSAPTRVY